MILALVGLAAALQSAAPPPHDHLPSKAMRATIEACGFKRVWVGRNTATRVIVRVSDTSATDEQLVCAAKALDTTFYGSEFAPELALRFAPIRTQIARPRLLAEARARFARQPERGAPPERLSTEADIAVARRTETFCGPAADGAFVEEADSIQISGDWMQQRSSTPDAMVAMADTLGCIVQAAVIAELDIGAPGTEIAAD